MSLWWKVGGISGALAVALGAFGAHGLRTRVTDERLLKAYETGAHYHLIHSLAILFAASTVPIENDPISRATNALPSALLNTIKSSNGRMHHLAGGLFLSGILLFSGSLYGMAVTENRKLGAITPIGGLCFIGGWVALAFSRIR